MEKPEPTISYHGALVVKHAFSSSFEYLKKLHFFNVGVGFSLTELPTYENYGTAQKLEYLNHFYTPYLTFGIPLRKYNVTMQPNVNVGYTLARWHEKLFLFNELTHSQNRLYTAAGLDINFKITNCFSIGFGTSYKMHFLLNNESYSLVFTDQYLIQHADFLNASCSIGFNF